MLQGHTGSTNSVATTEDRSVNKDPYLAGRAAWCFVQSLKGTLPTEGVAALKYQAGCQQALQVGNPEYEVLREVKRGEVHGNVHLCPRLCFSCYLT